MKKQSTILLIAAGHRILHCGRADPSAAGGSITDPYLKAER